ncbi:hypothetical protein ONS96_007300 [Cadophora gregata f. sp. sojae]|nr:hypothetical protein ONS96_007300 [Cadophora gregata f. sp. sojae]
MRKRRGVLFHSVSIQQFPSVDSYLSALIIFVILGLGFGFGESGGFTGESFGGSKTDCTMISDCDARQECPSPWLTCNKTWWICLPDFSMAMGVGMGREDRL